MEEKILELRHLHWEKEKDNTSTTNSLLTNSSKPLTNYFSRMSTTTSFFSTLSTVNLLEITRTSLHPWASSQSLDISKKKTRLIWTFLMKLTGKVHFLLLIQMLGFLVFTGKPCAKCNELIAFFQITGLERSFHAAPAQSLNWNMLTKCPWY